MQENLKIIWRRFGRRRQAPCERLEKTLSLYADGVANAKETRQVESHIAACDSCKAHLAAIRATSSLLSKQPEPVLPHGLSERLRLAIQTEREAERPRQVGREHALRPAHSPRWALAGALGSVALVAALVTGTHLLLTSQRPPVANQAPSKVALAPAQPSSRPAPPTAAKLAPAAPQRMASAQPGERAQHTAPLATIIRRAEPAPAAIDHNLPKLADANAPERSSVIAHRPSPKRAAPSRPIIVAQSPATPTVKSPIIGETFPGRHPRAPQVPSSEQIAALPPQGPATHSATAAPPVVNNLNTGEQPVQVAQVPASQPSQANATGPASYRLISRLKLPDFSAHSAQVAINVERPVDYTGSLSIVGSSIR